MTPCNANAPRKEPIKSGAASRMKTPPAIKDPTPPALSLFSSSA
jgi:hypothetical protein